MPKEECKLRVDVADFPPGAPTADAISRCSACGFYSEGPVTVRDGETRKEIAEKYTRVEQYVVCPRRQRNP